MKTNKLDNQLTLITTPTNKDIIHIGAFIHTGTINEHNYPSGIAHFIEHMVFKGTVSYTAEALTKAIDAIGGEVNAYTTKTYTCYTVKTLARFEQEAVNILKEMLFNAVFPEEEIIKEKQVVLEEIKMIDDDGEEFAIESLEKLAFFNTPYMHPILGYKETVAEMTKSDLQSFYNQFYTPSNMIISYVGNNISFPHGFNDVKSVHPIIENNSLNGTDPEKPIIRDIQKSIVKDGLEQAHIVMFHESAGYVDKKYEAFHVMNQIYGGNMSSKLFTVLREQHALCYQLYSSVESFRQHGMMITYVALDPANIDKCLALINNIHKDMLHIDETLIESTKRYLITNLYMNMDYDGDIMMHNGKSIMMYGHIHTLQEMEDLINAVTLEDVLNASQIFKGKSAQLIVVPA